MVVQFTGGSLESPDLVWLFCEYHSKLNEINPTFQPSATGWWKNEKKARLLVQMDDQKRLKGFVIVGYEDFVDSDVKSEICEIYSSTGYSGLMSLLSSALDHLSKPWGFQVYESNDRARKVFEYILQKKKLQWTVRPDVEKDAKVLKYRIHIQPDADLIATFGRDR